MSLEVEMLDRPLRKRDKGGCLLKRMFVVGLAGVFGGGGLTWACAGGTGQWTERRMKNGW